MSVDSLEKKHLLAQRLIRQLRRQRLLHSNGHSANSENRMSTNGMQHKKQLLVRDLGWTEKEAADNHARLKNFARFGMGRGWKSTMRCKRGNTEGNPTPWNGYGLSPFSSF